MGRWSWMDIQGQAGKIIRVISAYRVSQESPKQVGDLTACKQQYWSYVQQGVNDPNPKRLFLQDLGKFINRWKNISEKNSIILMMDSNESLERGNPLHDFLIDHSLVDAISYLNPSLKNDKTYLYGFKQIDHIFLSPELAYVALKAGHHQFYQHFVTDYKGVYIHFKVRDLFEEEKIDSTKFAFRELQLENRERVEEYITSLEKMYEDNNFVERLQVVSNAIHSAPNEEERNELQRLDKLDIEKSRYMRAAEKKLGIKKNWKI